MKLSDIIEAKILQRLAESSEEDVEKLHKANEVFESIISFVENLNQDPKNFDKKFMKDNENRLYGIKLHSIISMPETENMRVLFFDYDIEGVKKTIKAKAGRKIEGDQLKSVYVSLFFDAPSSVKENVKTYNRWFAKNLINILNDSRYRSSFVHEFTHTLDYRRINPEYLVARAKQKISEKEAKKTKDRDKYINDPLELNAYYQQAMSDIYNKLLATETVEEWNKLIGNTPQEFVEVLLANLRPQVQKRLNPENVKRLMKRASTTWEYLRLT